MKKKEFKAESKKLMNLMINSIYTNKEIFLRELISNASDAIDKLNYASLTDHNIKVSKKDFAIFISIDKNSRTLSISDNGIGMTKEELEKNLGTIAKSGSQEFKSNIDSSKKVEIIGQFGVGFYSAFMVAKKVEVISKAYGSEEAYSWISEGIDGYVIKECTKADYGTTIILTLKDNVEEENYDEYLETYKIQELIKKYSDYITYPIKMEIEHQKPKKDAENEYENVKEIETINSLIPLWKRPKNKITDEEYNTFYSDKFFDYIPPLTHIHNIVEGTISYNSLLYIPSHAPFDFYSKDYEKGLQLYSNGVLIMEKCADLLPDYYSFVKGIVDSPDLSLNISRETLQQDRLLKTIAKSIEGKITKELENLRDNKREDYEKFYQSFGLQLKYGVYQNYGMNKDKIADLLLFYSSVDKKYITLKEYVNRKKDDQKSIYYACGESLDKIALLPKVEALKDQYEILYCIDYIDEFALKMLDKYADLNFVNVNTENIENDDKEQNEDINKANEKAQEMFKLMREAIPEVKAVHFTSKLKNHPVCLTSSGAISVEMEKALNQIPNEEKIKADKVLEININHNIVKKLEDLYKTDKEALQKYSKVLYAQARLIEGLPIENPTEISNIVCEFLAK